MLSTKVMILTLYTVMQWENLKDFHAKHYHPSNGRFFTYGNMPLAGNLEYINNNILNKFIKTIPNYKIPLEQRWNQPVCKTISLLISH